MFAPSWSLAIPMLATFQVLDPCTATLNCASGRKKALETGGHEQESRARFRHRRYSDFRPADIDEREKPR
jgi:hypothetical protein